VRGGDDGGQALGGREVQEVVAAEVGEVNVHVLEHTRGG